MNETVNDKAPAHLEVISFNTYIASVLFNVPPSMRYLDAIDIKVCGNEELVSYILNLFFDVFCGFANCIQVLFLHILLNRIMIQWQKVWLPFQNCFP